MSSSTKLFFWHSKPHYRETVNIAFVHQWLWLLATGSLCATFYFLRNIFLDYWLKTTMLTKKKLRCWCLWKFKLNINSVYSITYNKIKSYFIPDLVPSFTCSDSGFQWSNVSWICGANIISSSYLAVDRSTLPYRSSSVFG